jgi:hypothetical protein
LLRIAPGAAAATPVLETEQPIASLAISRDGAKAAYVLGRLADAGKGKAQLNLFVHPLAGGATPTQVPLRPGEQTVSPSF